MMEIFFVRHGETEWNRKELLQGTTDVPLSESGRAQAREAAKAIKGLEFDAIYVSPLGRARETAHIILDGKADGIVIEHRLRERHFGKFEGETLHRYNSHVKENPEFNPEEAETRDAVRERIGGFFADCAASGKKRILVVAHGGVFSSLLMHAFGLSRDEAWKYRLENCEVCLLRVSKDSLTLVKGGKEVLEKRL